MNVKSIEQKHCCGCSACASICPVQAIRMMPDDKGFIYPKVDESRCINCNICVDVCEKAHSIKKTVIESYAIKNLDNEIRRKSSSGGISYALCKKIISMGGVCYGVAYDKDFKVITCRADTIEKCEMFFGSKYVESDPLTTFSQVACDLQGNMLVLYFGTSCRVAGLLSYLDTKGISTEKLLTVDLVCHGVPSPKVFEDFIGIFKKKGIKRFSFRTKKIGWDDSDWNYACTLEYLSGKEEVNSPRVRSYYTLFSHNYILRPHCFQCDFSSPLKPADITIADYWGIHEQHPDLYDNLGVSAVMAHTQKGMDILHSIPELAIFNSDMHKISKKQHTLSAPSTKNPDENRFWDLYNSKGYMAAAMKFGDINRSSCIRYYLWKWGLLQLLRDIKRKVNKKKSKQ